MPVPTHQYIENQENLNNTTHDLTNAIQEKLSPPPETTANLLFQEAVRVHTASSGGIREIHVHEKPPKYQPLKPKNEVLNVTQKVESA
jgi:hypothetical protein